MRRKLLLLLMAIYASSIAFGQLNENFDGATFPPTGWALETGSGDWDQSSEIADHTTGTASFARYDCWNISGTTAAGLITPKLDVTSTDKTLAFWANYYLISGTYGNTAELYVDVSNDNGTTWTTGTTNYISGQDGAGWFQTTIDLSSYEGQSFVGSVVLVKFRAISDYGSYNIGVDDVTGPAIYVPACPDPTAQVESNITTSGADLGWTDTSGSHWDIYVVATGGAAPTQTTAPTANDVTANPYTWTGGSTATTYDWYVRSDCDQDNIGTSAWVGPSTFTTACATFSVPFSEDFANSSTPNCWSNDSTETWLFSTGAGYGASSAGDHTSGGGTNYAWIDGSGGVNPNALITPFIDVSSLTTPSVEFYYFSNNTNTPGDNNTLIVDFWDGATWNNLLTYSGDNADWQMGQYDLSAYTISGDVQFRFIVSGTASTTYHNDILVDDILVDELPSCLAPTALTISDLTTTTAKLTWNSASGVTGYNWEVVPSGNGQGNGVVASGSISDTSAVATGLSAATTYDAYVQSDCGSSYVGPVTFVTDCPAKVTTFPYTTDFDNAGLIPNCWTNDAADAGGDWEFVTDNSHGPAADHTTGSGYYALLNDFSIYSSESPFNLLTPVFDLSTADKWYKVSYWAWIGLDGAANPIYFEVSLDGGTTWKTLYTHDHSNTGTWFKTEIELGFNKSANVVFRFRGMSIWGYGTDNSGIDDFTIEETQAPPVPLSDWAVYAVVFFILSFLVIRFKRRLA